MNRRQATGWSNQICSSSIPDGEDQRGSRTCYLVLTMRCGEDGQFERAVPVI